MSEHGKNVSPGRWIGLATAVCLLLAAGIFGASVLSQNRAAQNVPAPSGAVSSTGAPVVSSAPVAPAASSTPAASAASSAPAAPADAAPQAPQSSASGAFVSNAPASAPVTAPSSTPAPASTPAAAPSSTPAPASTPAASTISLEDAKSVALKHAGLSAASVTFTKAKLDTDDGVQVYEVEFYSGTTEWEYDIRAADGAVLSYEQDVKD